MYKLVYEVITQTNQVLRLIIYGPRTNQIPNRSDCIDELSFCFENLGSNKISFRYKLIIKFFIFLYDFLYYIIVEIDPKSPVFSSFVYIVEFQRRSILADRRKTRQSETCLGNENAKVTRQIVSCESFRTLYSPKNWQELK